MLALGHGLGLSPADTLAATWWELTTLAAAEIDARTPKPDIASSGEVLAHFRALAKMRRPQGDT